MIHPGRVARPSVRPAGVISPSPTHGETPYTRLLATTTLQSKPMTHPPTNRRTPRLAALVGRVRALHPARRSGHGPESGVAMVEFALILPLVLIFLLLILDFGRAINYWIDTTHLASEGARLAAVDKVPTGSASLQDHIKDRADTEELRTGGATGVVEPGLEVCVEYPDGREVGSPVTVTVSAEYDWIPFLGDNLGLTQTTIKGSATHRLERDIDEVDDGCES